MRVSTCDPVSDGACTAASARADGDTSDFPQVMPDEIPAKLDAEEQRIIERLTALRERDGAYFQVHATRLQLIGYALNDSPAGLAAWIYEHMRTTVDDPINIDCVLHTITIYWLTQTAASSARFYLEQASLLGKRNNPGRVTLPVGCSLFPKEVVGATQRWARQVYPNLFYWRDVERGGHFAGLEQPELFVRELRDCFRSFRRA
jgi:hypothetical protein